MEILHEGLVKTPKISLMREQEQRLDKQISGQRGLISLIQEKAFEFRREQPSKVTVEVGETPVDDGSVYSKLACLSDYIEVNNRKLSWVLSHLTELV